MGRTTLDGSSDRSPVTVEVSLEIPEIPGNGSPPGANAVHRPSPALAPQPADPATAELPDTTPFETAPPEAAGAR